MTQSERFEYLLVVKDEANPAIRQTGDNAAAMGGALKDVRNNFAALGAEVRTFGSRDLGDLKGYLNAGRERLEKTSGALAALSGAFGQGESMLAKFGQAGVQLAATFAVGGPVLAGVTALTVAYGAYKHQVDENAAAESVWREQITSTSRTMRDAARDSVVAMRHEVERLQQANEDYGKSNFELAIKEAGIRKADLESRLQVIEATDRLRQAAVNEAQAAVYSAKAKGRGIDEANDKLEMALAIQGNVQRNAAEYRAAVSGLEGTIWGIADAWQGATNNAKAAVTAVRTAAKDTADAYSGEDFGDGRILTVEDERADEQRRVDAREDAREAARKLQGEREREHEAKLLASKKATDDEVERQANAHYARLTNAAKSFHDGNVSLGLSSFSMLSNAGGEFFDNVITGQEHATEKFAVAMLKQTGSALVSYGTTLAAKAVVDGFTPGLQPLAIAEGVTAAGMIATGMALGAAGSAVQHAAVNGGTIGKALPDDKKVAARTSTGSGSLGAAGGSSGGSGVNITIVYGGVSGPEAESGARNLTTGLGLAQRRGRINKRVNHR